MPTNPDLSTDATRVPAMPARRYRSTGLRIHSVLVALLGLRLLTTGTGCDNPDTCDLGAAACVDNIALNCGEISADEGQWKRRDCGAGLCIVTDDNRPQAVCTATSEPDNFCADYSAGLVLAHQRCEGGRVVDCLGEYRQAEAECQTAEVCEQWEEEIAFGSIALAACVESPPAP